MLSLSPGLGRHRHTLDPDWPMEDVVHEKDFNSGKKYKKYRRIFLLLEDCDWFYYKIKIIWVPVI